MLMRTRWPVSHPWPVSRCVTANDSLTLDRLCRMEVPPPDPVDPMLSAYTHVRRDPSLTIVAHNIRSMANVGALFRTCDGAGASELILSGYTGTPPDKRIAKVALGAEQALPWRSFETVEQLMQALDGMFVIVLEQSAEAVTLQKLELPEDQPIAIVACEELFGADDEILARADAVLELPMRGFKQSLNVSVAAGVAMYAVADRIWGSTLESLASRQDRPPVREGVLTLGVTTGQTPDRHTYPGRS